MENPGVDNVPAVLAYLDSVSHLEGAAPHDEAPPRQVHDGLSERDGDTRRKETQKGREGLDPLEPHAAHGEESEGEARVGGGFAPAILCADILGVSVDDGQDEPAQHYDHDDDRQGEGNPVVEVSGGAEFAAHPSFE